MTRSYPLTGNAAESAPINAIAEGFAAVLLAHGLPQVRGYDFVRLTGYAEQFLIGQAQSEPTPDPYAALGDLRTAEPKVTS